MVSIDLPMYTMTNWTMYNPFTVPGPVSLPEVNENETNSTSALVQWSPPSDPNGIIISYRLEYRVTSTDPAAGAVIMEECVVGGVINRNVPLGNVTMTQLTGLSK